MDDLHASEDLKARLLAMQTAQTPAPAAPARKKAVYFPLKRVLGIAACFGVGFLCCGAIGFSTLGIGMRFLCCGAIGFSTLGIGMRAGSANSTAAVMSARNAVPQMASYQMDMENALPDIAADRALEPQARTGGQEAAQAGAKIIYTARLTLESKDYDDARAQLDQPRLGPRSSTPPALPWKARITTTPGHSWTRPWQPLAAIWNPARNMQAPGRRSSAACP